MRTVLRKTQKVNCEHQHHELVLLKQQGVIDLLSGCLGKHERPDTLLSVTQQEKRPVTAGAKLLIESQRERIIAEPLDTSLWLVATSDHNPNSLTAKNPTCAALTIAELVITTFPTFEQPQQAHPQLVTT